MKTFTCGDFEISSVEESMVPFRTVPDLYPDADDETVDKHLSWMAPVHLDTDTGMMPFSFKSYVVRSERLTILVDAGVGNHKDRPGRPNWHDQNYPFLADLAAVGVKPEDVDLVVCTHLHIDHVGWNTQLKDDRWVPTFPNARYLFTETEHDHWRNMLGASEVGDNVFNDSVLPVVKAGRADLVAMDHEIEDGIFLEPIPGHTPGHVALRIDSGGDSVAFTGDLFHHPLQVYEPQLSSSLCSDPDLARQSRHDFMNKYTDSDTLICPTHFTGTEVGYLRSNGDGYRFEFV